MGRADVAGLAALKRLLLNYPTQSLQIVEEVLGGRLRTRRQLRAAWDTSGTFEEFLAVLEHGGLPYFLRDTSEKIGPRQ